MEAGFGCIAAEGDGGRVRRREDDISRGCKGEGFVLGEGGEGEEEAEEEGEQGGGTACRQCYPWRAM